MTLILRNTGKGRKEGENRLSVTELNKLVEAGHSKEEIANRAMTKGEWADAKKGSKAQALLDSWMAEFTTDTQPGGGQSQKMTQVAGGTKIPPSEARWGRYAPGGGQVKARWRNRRWRQELAGGGGDLVGGGGTGGTPVTRTWRWWK